MKRNYEKPNMDLEMFEANEYIAGCFIMQCNKYGYVYEETNQIPGLQTSGSNRDKYKHENIACGSKWHRVTAPGTNEPTKNAYIVSYSGSVTEGYHWDDHFSTSWKKDEGNHS